MVVQIGSCWPLTSDRAVVLVVAWIGQRVELTRLVDDFGLGVALVRLVVPEGLAVVGTS